MLQLGPPNAAWRGAPAGIGGCGDTQLRVAGTPPTMLPLNCAGRTHVYLRDLDGSLWGTPGVVFGQEGLPRDGYRYISYSLHGFVILTYTSQAEHHHAVWGWAVHHPPRPGSHWGCLLPNGPSGQWLWLGGPPAADH